MIRLIKVFLTLLGIIDSAYLLFNSMNSCPINGCSTLIVAEINIPALLGLIWFSTYPFTKNRFRILWQILALIGVSFLMTYAAITSHYCPYCFLAYLLGILLIALDRIYKLSNKI